MVTVEPGAARAETFEGRMHELLQRDTLVVLDWIGWLAARAIDGIISSHLPARICSNLALKINESERISENTTGHRQASGRDLGSKLVSGRFRVYSLTELSPSRFLSLFRFIWLT